MLTFDEIGEILDEVAAELPQDFYRELNGGVNLLPVAKYHEESRNGDLYVLGEYCHNAMGRYINIYYGSLTENYPYMEAREMRARLKQLLIHEFTHHLESLAGEHDLEDKDEERLEGYKNNNL
ncbi:MAG: metallopeptidase family protein [Oscillospiraceae bacterium]|jgi:hypothetical protein|nr:metallopeptidase family protein [Oscillospiraceae bacterium]